MALSVHLYSTSSLRYLRILFGEQLTPSLLLAGAVKLEEIVIHEPGDVIYNTSKTEESTMSQYRKKILLRKMIGSFVNGIYHTEGRVENVMN